MHSHLNMSHTSYGNRCLCLGYNSMGYEMSKPNLRAELEADLKLVSEGRKDKQSVLRHHIQKYKTVFTESARKAKKLVPFLMYHVYPNPSCEGLSCKHCKLVIVMKNFLLLPQVRWSPDSISGRSTADYWSRAPGHWDATARQEVPSLWAGHGSEEEKGRKQVRRSQKEHKFHSILSKYKKDTVCLSQSQNSNSTFVSSSKFQQVTLMFMLTCHNVREHTMILAAH